MRAQAGRTIDQFGLDQSRQIQYTFNDQGFRGSKNFDYCPRYAFFGGSLVFGIGVPQHQTFPYLFENSHNYGLAGIYDNHDVMQILTEFLSSDIFDCNIKILVVWHSRDAECLDLFYQDLSGYDNIKHFFCGPKLPYTNCYKSPQNLDQDISCTHPGVITHRLWYRILKSLLD